MKKKASLLFYACSLSLFSFSQEKKDSLSFTLPKIEEAFLKNNYLLLAQKYNIDIAKALVIQARLLPNPTIQYSQVFYQTQAKKFLVYGSEGEQQAALSQLILLAGKINKQVKIAKANVTLSEYQFFDLVRTLKYTLRSDFFNIYYLLQEQKVYDQEIASLQQVVTAFEQQEGKGYIAEKEILRVKALLYSLQSEYNDLINQINDTESELKLLMQVKSNVFVVPQPELDKIAALSPGAYPFTLLTDTAFKSRTDLQIARQNIEISRLNYTYQKALAVPDITLGMNYDQQGSYIKNLTMVGFGINLPIFNRNQGNIKAAKVMMDMTKTVQKSTELTVEENVSRALEKAYAQDKLFHKIDAKFLGDFDRMLHEVFINYQKRNIGLLDFLDFYNAYKQNWLQVNNIMFNRVSAFEDLNFYTGVNLFN